MSVPATDQILEMLVLIRPYQLMQPDLHWASAGLHGTRCEPDIWACMAVELAETFSVLNACC